jgi:hypothetical protein
MRCDPHSHQVLLRPLRPLLIFDGRLQSEAFDPHTCSIRTSGTVLPVASAVSDVEAAEPNYPWATQSRAKPDADAP